MGYRLHVARKYNIELCTGVFNNKYNEFLDYIIDEVDASTYYDGLETMEFFIPTIKDHIKKLRRKSEEELNKFAFDGVTYREILDFWIQAVSITERDNREYIIVQWS